MSDLVAFPAGRRDRRGEVSRRDTVAGAEYEIAALRRENAALRAQIEALGSEPVSLGLEATHGLTGQQAALIGALLAVHPRGLDWYAIDEATPHQDHAADRDLRWVSVQVCRLRRRFGKDAIENIWGRGYRISDAFASQLKAGGSSIDRSVI